MVRRAERPPTNPSEWIVARVCSEYIQYCEDGLSNGSISKSHRDNAVVWLNDLCGYCGAMPVPQLKKGHIQKWVDRHETWRSPATRRGVLAVVQAAFNRSAELFGVPNPIKGLKKPTPEPRLASFTAEDEQALYDACEPCFQNFLFAAIHTGLRPFCELAKLTADDIEVVDRGMMWRIYSTKNEKTRKIPVRPEVASLTRTLMKTAPKGSGKPIFRNTQGNPWKRMTGVVRFIGLKKKLGWDADPVKGNYSCYTCRHTFAHRMLSGFWTKGAGCSIETLAELMGDTPQTAFRHYAREWGQYYQDPLWAAIGETSRQKGPLANRQERKATRTKQTADSRTRQKPTATRKKAAARGHASAARKSK